ncbi:dinuclear metal center YbgI/SA1388 family protein [Isoptericola sp. CG 20/1183]|uniref:GTP cyclohydrolase 1 type 2 homolog n=1 Tax=Isoptericola halotolerans TaxID=300560 RepID=A0ABX5E9X8_9MICO|nr:MULTISPECIES: Nif3-like dinuclear metal center hexameric protein [Isoptericola]PRZ03232.1 dinuclear metal center YbgI/SA1388 family protein [Isoptericola sp. CG 20/1183]PRZ03556.1 dinuclear metal center YbgI/SA1388 family protein [Isoptericola halotolerans]
MSAPTLADVVTALEDLYPPSTAEGWDAVGLVAGDPQRQVRKVMFAIDPVSAVVDEAIEWGADLLVTHHPLFLKPVTSVAATTFKGAVVHRLLAAGCALHVAHTNADSAPRGVADALADLVGITDRRPLVARDDDGERGIGRVGSLEAPTTLGELARRVADVLPATAQGVRVAGDLDAEVTTAAVVGGSGDSLFDAVRAAAVDVYVTADLRHHPASELRERAAFEAGQDVPPEGGRPFLVDVAHFASEWPWLAYAAADLADRLGGGTVTTRVSTLVTDPWTTRVASTGR